MRKHQFITVAMLAVTAAATAAGPSGIAGLFAAAPQSVVPYIDSNKRLDMLDYFSAGSPTAINSTLNAPSRIMALTDSCLTYSTGNDSVTCTMAILPSSADSVVMVINTVPMPWPDSRVAFYGGSWTPADGRRVWSEPRLADWMQPERRNEADMASVRAVVPFIVAEMTYNPATRRLTLTNNTRRYFAQGDRPAALDAMCPQLVYEWNGKKFELLRP